MVGNQGLPLAPIPTRRLAVLTQITSEFAHCSLSGAERRKKKHPDVPGMYSASVSCSASRKRNPVSRPSAVCTLCMGILFASDKSGWIHASLHNEWKEHPSIIVMPSRRQLLHFFFFFIWMTATNILFVVSGGIMLKDPCVAPATRRSFFHFMA